MPDDRLVRVLKRLAAGGGSEPMSTRLCVVSAEITEMSGAGIMLMTDDQPQGSVCTTDEVSAVIEELQYTLGVGPCVDAYRHNQPVYEPDLADPDEVRWIGFSAPAVAAGARAVFGFPITVDDIHVGALNLYRDRPGPLSDDQHADALVLATVAGRSIITAYTGDHVAVPDLADLRYVVHQAAGMVSVQLNITADAALIRLRAYAFGHDRTTVDVATAVVERRLRFDEAGPERQ